MEPLRDGALQPRPRTGGLGSSGFARHYSRHRLFLYFPPVTEMFHFTGFDSTPLRVDGLAAGVTPFGNLRIKA